MTYPQEIEISKDERTVVGWWKVITGISKGPILSDNITNKSGTSNGLKMSCVKKAKQRKNRVRKIQNSLPRKMELYAYFEIRLNSCQKGSDWIE